MLEGDISRPHPSSQFIHDHRRYNDFRYKLCQQLQPANAMETDNWASVADHTIPRRPDPHTRLTHRG